MKAGVRALSVIATAWTLFTFFLIGLMMVPVVPGAVQVQLPSPDSWVTSIDNETVMMTNNISIRNGGFFPFSDLLFVLELYGTNNTVLAAFNTTETDLRPNTWAQIPVTFQVNRSNLRNNEVRDVLFNKVTFGGLVYFNTRYLLDFRAQLGINSSITVGPLIKEDFDVNRTVVSQDGANMTLSIPYSLNTSNVLYGRNLSITGTISNETGVLGSIDQTIALGVRTEGNLTINLTQGAYEHLTTSSDHLLLNVTVTIGDLAWTYQSERDWQPKGGG